MDVFSANARRTGRSARRRRVTWLPACIGLAFALVLPTAPRADAAPTHSRPADSFVGSIGVNTHFYYSDTPYVERFELVKQRLAELGVRHVRENIAPDHRPDQYQRLRELAAMGIKANLILGEPTNGISTLDEMLSVVKTELGGALDAVEGPNEFDARGVTNWQPMLREYQQHLHAAVKSDPSLSSLTVVAPSIVQLHNEKDLGDISDMVDVGNIHSYADGEPPEQNAAESLARASLNAPNKPLYATEAGYSNALNWGGELRPVSEAAMATYMPRVFLENYRLGFARTLAYELLDEFPDPGLVDRESNFGLLRNDLSKKPAFEALQNMIDILEDPGGPFEPNSIDYSVSGGQPDLRRVLLQKRDGSFYLALWRTDSVWNSATKAELAAHSAPVRLSFSRRVNSAQRYMPNLSAAPLESVPIKDARQLTVDLGAQVVILRLELGKPRKGRIRLWVSKRSVPPGGGLAVRGRLPKQTASRSLVVKVQRWHRRGWRAIGRTRTSRFGTFRKKIRMPRRADSRRSRLRVVTRVSKPSRAVRIRIR